METLTFRMLDAFWCLTNNSMETLPLRCSMRSGA
jgi:hypothetical protein